MYVCICHSVTDREIREAADSGVRTVRQLRKATGCSGSCGQCATMAKQLLDENQPSTPSLFGVTLEPVPA
jgi:bacterioferritin-associated ferredoxin